MDAETQLMLPSTFGSLALFLGYIRFQADKDLVRPWIEYNYCFRSESDATVIVPPDKLPVGLLFWDNEKQEFALRTVQPNQEEYR